MLFIHFGDILGICLAIKGVGAAEFCKMPFLVFLLGLSYFFLLELDVEKLD